ncbi:MAG: DUF3943 domain-containing protein [Deltaproteobacteria bacterium]|nr:DUF3943 domain-containing protein [Deltaproteobacteria bacterium]
MKCVVVLACTLHFGAARAGEVAASGEPVGLPSQTFPDVVLEPSLSPPFQLSLGAQGFRFPESTFEEAEHRNASDELAALQGFELFPEQDDPTLSRWVPPSLTLATFPARPPLSGLRNADRRFATKATRSLLTITGIEIASGVALAFLPQNFSRWDSDVLSRAGANLKRAWTRSPVWDDDIFFHNFIGHPYAGAYYFNMVRSQGATTWQSFGYAVFQSTFWEYCLEAMAEQPSIQDLFITPVVGSLLGELFHNWSLHILRKGSLSFGEKALVFFLNPAYVVNNGFRQPE